MTTESRRLIASLAEAKCRPTFEVRQLKSAPGWYVRVLWQYGLEQRVNGFASADEAQTWINKKSEGWLRNRTAPAYPRSSLALPEPSWPACAPPRRMLLANGSHPAPRAPI